MKNKEETIDLSGDKYKDKSLRFSDFGNYYELIFTDEFVMPDKEYTVATDIMLDLKEADKEKEIHIYVNSHGGWMPNLSMMMQQLLEFKHRVTISAGSSLSAGFLLFCCGHERYVSSFSELMYHSISTDAENCKGFEISRLGTHYREITNYYNEVLNMKDILSKEEMEMGETTEVWFSGADLIKRGVALNYLEFKNRSLPEKEEFFVKNGRYFKMENDSFIEYKKTEIKLTHSELVKIPEEKDKIVFKTQKENRLNGN